MSAREGPSALFACLCPLGLRDLQPLVAAGRFRTASGASYFAAVSNICNWVFESAGEDRSRVGKGSYHLTWLKRTRSLYLGPEESLLPPFSLKT